MIKFINYITHFTSHKSFIKVIKKRLTLKKWVNFIKILIGFLYYPLLKYMFILEHKEEEEEEEEEEEGRKEE